MPGPDRAEACCCHALLCQIAEQRPALNRTLIVVFIANEVGPGGVGLARAVVLLVVWVADGREGGLR